MPEIDKHQTGDFCWVELGTSDAADAKRFYGSLFGWTPMDLPMGEAGTYTMLMRRDLPLGAMYQLADAQKQQGIPPHWLLYVAVASVDESIARLTELGGKVAMGPHDIPGAGRMAVLLDPPGAVFAIWEAKGHIGSRVTGEDGVLTWSELATTDAPAATEFYTGLFGWETKVSQMGPVRLYRMDQLRPSGGRYVGHDERVGGDPSALDGVFPGIRFRCGGGAYTGTGRHGKGRALRYPECRTLRRASRSPRRHILDYSVGNVRVFAGTFRTGNFLSFCLTP